MRGKSACVLIILLLLIGGAAAYLIGVRSQRDPNYVAAKEALARRDFFEAGRHLQKYLETTNDPDALLLAAQIACRQGNFAKAIAHLGDYRLSKGSTPELESEHELVRLHQGQVTESDWGRIDVLQAENLHTESVALHLEAFIEGSLKLLESAFLEGETRESGAAAPQVARVHNVVDRWLQHRPSPADQAQGLVWRSRLHAFANDSAKALADVRAALRIDPGHFEAGMQLAQSVMQESPREAAATLETLYHRNPANNRVRFMLALVRRSLGQLDEAGRILDDILAASPGNLSALLERGKLALDANKPGEAETPLRRALVLAPKAPEVYLSLVRCLRLAGKSEEADQYYERYRRLIDERLRLKEQSQQKGKS
jgi:Flp pilus assembly protein TadD